LLCALSPWHLPLSLYCTEDILASTTVSLAVVWFFLWQKRRGIGWLLLSGMFFGLTLYAYGVTTVFTPFMLGFLAMLYWRDIRESPRTALVALLILLAFMAPQAFLILRRPAEMRAHFDELSLYRYVSDCRGCRWTDRIQAAFSAPFLIRLGRDFVASWLGYLSPDFLFLAGDRGSHWELVFPPGFGMLLPEQAVLIGLALIAALRGRRRKLVVLLLGWVMLAAVPAAMLVPAGVWGIEPGGLPTPTPWSLIKRPPPNPPLTAWLLFCHPQARHDVLAIAPWILLSALGFVTLLELTSTSRAGLIAMLALLVAGATFHGSRFVRSYFVDYPIQAAPYFHYGLDEVMRYVQELDDMEPIIISPRIDQAYAYVLFYEHYPPARLQRELLQGEGLIYHWSAYPLKLHPHAQPIQFNHYYFSLKPNFAYQNFERAIIVLVGNEPSPVPPVLSVHLPDGRPAYQVIRWDREHP